MVGPTGPIGVTGSQGPTGATGPQGPPGVLGVTVVMNQTTGALPKSGGLTTAGGTLLLHASGSAYLGGGGTIAVDVRIDGASVGQLRGYTNEAFSHTWSTWGPDQARRL